MGLEDKISNASDKVAGTLKQTYGKVTGDKETQAEGAAQKTKGEVKETGEKAKDTLKDAADSAEGLGR
ncbi:CsbD family protein [Nesterenkonia muleiensis]|uniref:CsbD family protein n=1 Tax=Nesterenkonia muleiensis TaxID=2282648 RepID=UPI000E72275A|nr:CsbD family protein [Nesterenkonia muleiensis]